jgi:hypothetical protein
MSDTYKIKYTVIHTDEASEQVALGIYDTETEARQEAEALANHWYEQGEHYEETREEFDDVDDDTVIDTDYTTYWVVDGQSWRIIRVL